MERLVVCLLLLSCLAARSERPATKPSDKQAGQEHQEFLDFAVKQINPENTDYGCVIDEQRKLVVEATVKNLNSWALLGTMSLLLLSFFILLQQHDERTRRELIAAGFLAQYHNALVDARAYAEEAIRRNNELVSNAHGAENAWRPILPAGDLPQSTGGGPGLSSETKSKPTVPSLAKDTAKAAENDAERIGASQRNEPEGSLIAQISTLQQQLTASHERERALQTELAKVQRRTPQTSPLRERQRSSERSLDK
ncbi:MAG TPA: hypothetical protein VKH81_04200 [Candidatus Angelobacter sp.]|nr:hypothetical protein [Candidatus Angelobacter sp.]